jgi:membrane protein DedA with SNARE-associated domain
LLLGLAALRAVIGIIAIPLAPFLYREHAVVLVLFRPTKEVLMLEGFLTRRGEVGLVPVLIAAVPLIVLGVWQFFLLGRAYDKEIRDAELPGFVGRILPPKRINALAEAVASRGVRMVILGRLAVFPSSLMAAAAGVSGRPARRFLVADGVGALLSVVEVLGAGYLLGESYERAGPWVTVLGCIALLLMMLMLGRALRSGPATDGGLIRHLRGVRKRQGVTAMFRDARRQLSARA